jgi:hypothetical protein
VLSCTRACVNACMHTGLLAIRRDASKRSYVLSCMLAFVNACMYTGELGSRRACVHA